MNNIDTHPIPDYERYMRELMTIECSRQMCREFDIIIIKELMKLTESEKN